MRFAVLCALSIPLLAQYHAVEAKTSRYGSFLFSGMVFFKFSPLVSGKPPTIMGRVENKTDRAWTDCEFEIRLFGSQGASMVMSLTLDELPLARTIEINNEMPLIKKRSRGSGFAVEKVEIEFMGGQAGTSAAERSAQKRKAEENQNREQERVAQLRASGMLPDLELLSSNGLRTEYTTEITGKVRNNRARKYGYVQVTFTVYNKAGEQVGTALANANDLEPGGVWAFKAVYFGNAGTNFKLSGLVGH